MGITSPFGQGIKFDKNDLINPSDPTSAPLYEAQMALVNINPSVAFKLGEHLAIGAGADVILSTLTFKQHFPWPLGNPAGDAEVEAFGYSFGGNAGVTWFITDKQRLALTYRSPFKVEYEGDFEVSNFVSLPFLPPGTSAKSDFETAIEFPTIIGLGYGIELTDTIRIEANLEWLEWSLNQSLKLDLDNNQALLFGNDELPNNWDNTITFGIGGDWQFAPDWVFRAGYAFIETPIPDATISPLLPDTDRHALSLGLGYTTGPHSVDLAYTFSIYEDRDVSASANPVYPGSYDIASDLLGMTYSFEF